MAYTITNHVMGSQAIADVSTTQNHPLGAVVQAVDPTYGAGEFIYLKGVASTAVGSVVVYNPDDWTTALTAQNSEGLLAVAMSANTAATSYGWYQLQGKAVVKAGTVLDDGDCFLTSTAGQLDDAVVAGDKVFRAKFASANGTPSAGLAECEIDHPYSGNAKVLDSTEITATGAEVNILAGVTATAAEINRACDESARAVSLTTTPITISEASHAMKTVLLNKADGIVITLPAATGSGTRYRFHVATSASGGSYVIKVNNGSHVMDGLVFALDDTGTPVLFPVVTAADSDTITLDGATKGGIIGDWLELVDLAANQWGVHGFLKLSGTEASPFSATVS